MKILAYVLICSMLLFSQVMPPVNSPMSMCPAASASQTGCLASADWVTFNGKQAPITTGTQDQILNGTLALTSLVNCTASGGVYQYSTTSHTFTCHALVSADIPNNAANTSGTAASLSGTPALPNGTTATTQSQADGSTKLATTSYVDTGLATKQASLGFTPFQVPYATAIQLTGQTSAITTTTIATPAAGIYNVCGYLVTTTTGSAGTAGVTFGWNDGTQSETDTPTKLTAVTLTALGEGQGCTYLKSNGSAITYAVALTSVIGSPQYSFYSTIQRMN